MEQPGTLGTRKLGDARLKEEAQDVKKTEHKADESRRGFLKLMSVSAPAAAVSAVAATEADAAEPVEEQGSGLRMTAHVKAYLDSARF